MTGHVLTESKREMECCMLDVAVIIANIMFLAGFKTNKTNQKKKVIMFCHWSTFLHLQVT